MTIDAYITIAILALTFGLLIRTKLPTALIFLGALTLTITFRLAPLKESLKGFSNPGVLTIGALFMVAAGMYSTGAIGMITDKLIQSKETTATRVFLYPQMMHAKVVLTDGVIAAVGSANLTSRSMKTSREVTMFFHGKSDDPFIKRLRERLETDMAASEEVLTLFKLGITGKIKAFFGKYLW